MPGIILFLKSNPTGKRIMLKDFVSGVNIFYRGVSAFYGDKSLWRYAALPFLCTCAACAMLFYAAYLAGKWGAGVVANWTSGLPEYLAFLSGIASGAAVLAAFLIAAVIAISLLGVLYECFGGLFFDALIEKFSGRYYGTTEVKRDFRFDLDFILASAGYGIKTLLLSLPLMLLALLLPIAGQVIFVVVMGYRFGICYPAAAGYCRGKSFRESKQLLRPQKYVVAGFGISAYILLMLLPLSVIVLLPGIVLGGVILFQEKCSNSTPEL